MIFTKESLKHSIKPIVFVLLACALVFFWGRYRKVSVELTLRPAIEIYNDSPEKLDVTIYDEDGAVSATISQPVSDSRLFTQQLNMHPGNHHIRGTVTMKSGQRYIVEQIIVVPEDNASIEVFLRANK